VKRESIKSHIIPICLCIWFIYLLFVEYLTEKGILKITELTYLAAVTIGAISGILLLFGFIFKYKR